MKKTNITYHILYQILLSGEIFKICPFFEVFWQFLELVCVTLSKTTTNVGGSPKKIELAGKVEKDRAGALAGKKRRKKSVKSSQRKN